MEKLLDAVERKVIRLVEERGVAASKYNVVVDKIVRYIDDKIKTYENFDEGDTVTFTIPKDLASKIDFVEDLTIEVKVTEYKSQQMVNRGSGSCRITYRNGIVNGKLESMKITIRAFSFYHSLIEGTFLTSFYHEVNHVYEYYDDVMKQYGKEPNQESYPADRFHKTMMKSVQANKGTEFFYDDKKDNELFDEIVYRLFSETELNALVASVYGSLKGLKSKRENFNSDIKNTKAHKIYNYIKNNYKELFNKIDEVNYYSIKNYLRQIGVNINPYGSSMESYKKELIRKTNWCLKRLFNGMGRAASVYYDNAEFKFNKDDVIYEIDRPFLEGD